MDTRLTWPDVDFVVARTMRADALNVIANAPDVRPWLGGDGPLDLTAMLANPRTLAGVIEDGGFVADDQGDGRYEIHSLFRPTRHAIRAMRGALDYIFASSDATVLVTKVPHDNPAADGLAKLAGFCTLFSGAVPWNTAGRKNADVRSLSLDMWAMRSAACLAMGQWLHEEFNLVMRAMHSTLPPHSDEDPTHHRMAGAAALMVRAGNTAKGVLVYNRWAQLAGYPLIRWLRDQPVILDLEGITVEVQAGEIEVLLCQ